ncbi:toll/interleukin-1 receptor domain-containing protein [Serratia proteamaculans]
MSESKVSSWPSEEEWNDLLIVLYNNSQFSDDADKFVSSFLEKRPDTALILPIALDSTFPVPPNALSKFKALPYDPNNVLDSEKSIICRAGAMLGLRLQGRDTKIFISYRAQDGRDIAEQLYGHLLILGHKPWLDEAKELDGFTKILPGEPVQIEIEKALDEASLLLLIDTPASLESKWIKAEVNIADGKLIPILPIVFRPDSDPKKGPRFRTLLSLQRWLELSFNEPPAKTVLSSVELDNIILELETYLCDIFMRKCRIPFQVKKNFIKAGYDWSALNQSLSVYKSQQQHNSRIRTTVHSHCSIYSTIYPPSFRHFNDFLSTQPQANYSLFIYDGDLLSDEELAEWLDIGTIILHHQEISALLASNFTKVGSV